jgi:hypothetical protein
MTTFTTQLTGGSKGYPFDAPRMHVLKATFDATLGTYAQNDVLEMINVPAGTFISAVAANVVVVEGASRNYAVGDGNSTAGYIPTTTANTLGITASVPVAATNASVTTPVPVYGNGVFYAAADTIDILVETSGGLTTCKIQLRAMATDLTS